MLSCTCLRTPRFDCRQRSGSTPLANQSGGCDRRVHSEHADFWAKRMSLFIASLYQTPSRVCYIMSDKVLWPTCRFLRCDKLPWPPLRPQLRGPRWLWRKPTDVGRRDVKPGLVDIKGSGGLLQKNHCVWVNFLQCIYWEGGGVARRIPREMMTDWFISRGIREHLPLLAIWPVKSVYFSSGVTFSRSKWNTKNNSPVKAQIFLGSLAAMSFHFFFF